MNSWRMRLRCGFAKYGGEDMWPVCRSHRVAAITYEGIAHVDLRDYSEKNRPPRWSEVESKGSIGHFAYGIRGGDKVFVADSKEHQIVGMGFVSAPIGSLAYRFDPDSPIRPEKGPRWCHLIDVDWDDTFRPFRYHHPRAPMNTVLQLKPYEITSFDRCSVRENHKLSGLDDDESEQALLAEGCYSRYTPAALRSISRKHVALSNAFRKWLKANFGVSARQEQRQIDAHFTAGGETYLAEFKIAYLGDTRRAIREALGQILEYNHYPSREQFRRWLLILDEVPSQEDIRFIRTLKERHTLPLNLGWDAQTHFEFVDPLNLVGISR